MQRHFTLILPSASSPLLSLPLISFFIAIFLFAVTTQEHIALKEGFQLWLTSPFAWIDLIWGGKFLTLPLLGLKPLACLVFLQLLISAIARRPRKIYLAIIYALIFLLITANLLIHARHQEQSFPQNAQTNSYFTHPKQLELVLILQNSNGTQTVHSIPESLLKTGAQFPFPGFKLTIDRYFPNCDIVEEIIADESYDSIRATEGKGVAYAVKRKPREISPKNSPIAGSFVSIVSKHSSKPSRWLLSPAIQSRQSFELNNQNWQLALRPLRFYPTKQKIPK